MKVNPILVPNSVLKKLIMGWAVVMHAFDPSTWETDRWISESKASLVYRTSNRRAKATQRNDNSEKQNKNKNI